MAVDPRWLKQVRNKNRARFDMPPMAGMSGLGQSAQEIAATLQSTRSARTAETAASREAAAAAAARAALASDPAGAALLAIPQVEVYQPEPIPRTYYYIGAGLAALLLAAIFWPRGSR